MRIKHYFDWTLMILAFIILTPAYSIFGAISSLQDLWDELKWNTFGDKFVKK